jgi:hypothetical protein
LATTNEYGLIVPGNPEDPTWQKAYVDTVLETVLDQESLIDKAQEGAENEKSRP